MNGEHADVAPVWFDQALHWISVVVEGLGVTIIVLGALMALGAFASGLARRGFEKALYDRLRVSLAQAILLGLEFLVAADIIGTVAVEPTLKNLTVLGLIVLIRTFLSFSLEVEIHGRWPWHKGRTEG